jgi:hypothetical protein
VANQVNSKVQYRWCCSRWNPVDFVVIDWIAGGESSQ